MDSLATSDAMRLADSAFELGGVRDPKHLAALASTLLGALVPADRVTWIDVDVATGNFRGHQEPEAVPHRLATLPPDPLNVPIAGELIRRPQLIPLKISDFWSDRQWRAQPIYVDLYRPNDVLYQMVLPVEIIPQRRLPTARTIVAVSLTRGSHDFTERDRTVLREFGRHARRAHHRIAAAQSSATQWPAARSATATRLTPRQYEALRAVSDGSTIRAAATRMGISAKTLDNHLQAAYARLGVSSRIAAFVKLRSAGPTDEAPR